MNFYTRGASIPNQSMINLWESAQLSLIHMIVISTAKKWTKISLLLTLPLTIYMESAIIWATIQLTWAVKIKQDQLPFLMIPSS